MLKKKISPADFGFKKGDEQIRDGMKYHDFDTLPGNRFEEETFARYQGGGFSLSNHAYISSKVFNEIFSRQRNRD